MPGWKGFVFLVFVVRARSRYTSTFEATIIRRRCQSYWYSYAPGYGYKYHVPRRGGFLSSIPV
eukprot:scaffold40350_cov14-Prasinocladus_malaysianus.AAC.1